MQRIIASELTQHIGEEVLIRGWLNNIRKLGKINFLIVRDRGGFSQVVIEESEELDKVKNLQPGSILKIAGTVKASDYAENKAEIINPKIEVQTAIKDVPPVEYAKPEMHIDIDTLLDYRPLTLRNRRIQAIFKIQATLVKAYRDFLTSQGFTEFFGPSMIGASSEGGTELFKVQYFDQTALLSQSAQLYKQMMVGVYERVFALMKCFRAEKSNTRRHLTEATQFEFEMGFIDSFTDVMDMLEKTIKYMIKTVAEERSMELKTLGVELVKAPEQVDFPRITFKEALELYFERTGIDERNEIDLTPAAEKELCAYAREKFGTDFIFVTNFLRKKTAFYAMPNQDNPEVTDYFDLLCREAEIVSGGQRIHDHDQLVESLKLKELNPKDFVDYLSIFKNGMPPHGGFGMGMERFTMLALGLDNIREATLFPSDTKRVAAVALAAQVFLGSDLASEIIKRLKAAEIKFEEVQHQATLTSEDSAKYRHTRMSEGIKAIILRGKSTGKNVMVCVPSDQKVDIAKISELEAEKMEFEKSEQIKTKFGLEVGSIPPFGNLLGIKTYFSKDIEKEPRAAFNRGSLTDSIIMASSDLVKMVGPVMID